MQISEPVRGTGRRAIFIGGLASLLGVLPRKSWAAGDSPGAQPGFWTQPRAINVRNASTGERGEFVYWRDGAFVMPEYFALCTLTRDARENKAVQMDPRAFDLVYGTQAWFLGAERKRTETIITNGLRTPRTNVIVHGAPGSKHLSGEALDGHMVGVTLGVYASMCLAFGAGGVGLYARHVHWDVGRKPAFWRGGGKES